MKFTSCLLLAALSLYLMPLSAQPLPNTLLWRITGKDGHHTSYLYGTMHLTDDRVFNLGDSLYAAIAHTDGFATELDARGLTSLVIDEVQKQLTNTRNLRDLLPEKEYKTYGALLAKKLKKPVGSITSEDILREKNKWVRESYRQDKDKMETFLDVYLFDIARRQGKWTGGVEDVDDQRGYLNDIVDESDIRDLVAEEDSSGANAALERLISIYIHQDLSGIDSMTGHTDTILLKRNRKMAMRMDSLSAVRSMVFAVGAAHLPGQEGLISLLRRKGFDVQPVFSSHKIKAADYPVREIPVTWEAVKDDNGLYQVDMPGTPGNVDVYNVLKMKMYYDIFDGMAYLTSAAASVYREASMDSLMESMAGNLFHTHGKKDYAPVTINGAKGRIYTTRDQDGYKKGFFLSKGRIFYIAYVLATKETDKNLKNIDRFFQSFKVLEKATAQQDSLKMIPYVDSAMAYRIETPSPPQLYANLPKRPDFDSRAYISSDNREGTYYFFGVNATTPGHFIENDSVFFTALKASVFKNMSAVTSDTTYFVNDQRVIEFQGRMRQADMGIITRYIARGNRWYSLVGMYSSLEPTPEVHHFLSSFSLLDYPAHHWQQSFSPDSIVSTWLPSGLIIEKKDSADGPQIDLKYQGFDSSHSVNYAIVSYHLNPYYWSLSDSAFWEARVSAHLKYRDSLVYKRQVGNGVLKGWEFMKLPHNSHLYHRQRVVLYGNELYSLFIAGPRNEIESVNANRFFTDFRISGQPLPTNLLENKAERLLKDLLGEDSARAMAAFDYLNQAPFTGKDLPLLHQALLQKSPLDHPVASPGHADRRYARINNEIANKIRSLDDSSTFYFAAANYKMVPDSNAAIRNNLLELMVRHPDSAHFAVMTGLLKTSPPAIPLPISFLIALQDTLRLTANFFPELLPLFKDSVIMPSLLYLAGPLLDSNWLTIRQLKPYQEELMRYALFLTRPSAASDYSMHFDEQLIGILGRFNDARSNALLRKFLSVRDNSIRLAAVVALLRNQQAPDLTVLQSLGADKAIRLDLYRQLNTAGHGALFPTAFRTQKAFAESEVYREIQEEDVEADSIVFVATRLFDTNKGKKRFFFYRFVNEDGEARLACAGPYDLDPAKLNTSDARAVINFGVSFDTAHSKEQMDQLLQKFK